LFDEKIKSLVILVVLLVSLFNTPFSLFCGNLIALLKEESTVLLFAILLTDCRQICPDKLMICYLDTSANSQYLKKSGRLQLINKSCFDGGMVKTYLFSLKNQTSWAKAGVMQPREDCQSLAGKNCVTSVTCLIFNLSVN
jgi:hypothetical protein